MKRTPLFLAAVFLGCLVGWQLKVHSQPSPSAPHLPTSAQNQPAKPLPSSSLSATNPPEELLALPADAGYAQTALALLHAEAEDFPKFFEEFRNRDNPDHWVMEVLFMNWTRVDAEAALNATEGTQFEKYAWQIWAGQDPEKALTTSLGNEEHLKSVVWGIGEYHPRWLDENWDRIPKDVRWDALDGVGRWPNTETPESSIRLLANYHPQTIDSETLLALARKDPANAFAFVQKYSSDNSMQEETLLDKFIRSLERDPDLLAEIIPQIETPIGQTKARVAQFHGLLQEDPEAARALLETTESPALKAKLTTAYAKHLFNQSPEEALQFTIERIHENDETLAGEKTVIDTEGQSDISRSLSDEERDFLKTLVSYDAETLLTALAPSGPDSQETPGYSSACFYWGSQDLSAFSDWVTKNQDNPEIYNEGASNIASRLLDRREFEAAIAWAESTPADKNSEYLFTRWLESDREAALAWRSSDRFQGKPEDFPLPDESQAIESP